MATPEARFRSQFKTLIKKFMPISVENALFSPGLPDIAITPGWIELKFSSKWPAKSSTPFRIPHFTPEQKKWALDWTGAGGNYWLVCKVAGELFIFDAEKAQFVGGLTRAEMKETAMAHFPKWPLPQDICPYFEV